MAAFSEALSADSSCFNAWWLSGIHLLNARRVDEAYSRLAKAAEPTHSSVVHRSYSQAVRGLTDSSPEEKRLEIEADAARLLQARADEPGTLLHIAWIYGELGLAEKRAISFNPLLPSCRKVPTDTGSDKGET